MAGLPSLCHYHHILSLFPQMLNLQYTRKHSPRNVSSVQTRRSCGTEVWKYELSLIPQSALFRGLNFLILHKLHFSCSADIKTQKGHLEKFGAKMVWKQVVLFCLSSFCCDSLVSARMGPITGFGLMQCPGSTRTDSLTTSSSFIILPLPTFLVPWFQKS